ncbi:phosphatase 2C-like domain-containing protein [Lentinula boryana]|uniref:Protein phosphatase n=1 Tax=Lentinula boryana TaxID=40481 RepID=A0ABQ8QQK4_9AGAR|nr:phosphatase 2C-like domain-containing protein [Lentinula boryana]
MSRLVSKPRYYRCLRAHNTFRAFDSKRLQTNTGSQSSSCPRQLSTRSSSKASQPSDISSPSPVYPGHPYMFRIASSWAGKPSTGEDRATDDLPFPLESPIGRWREEMLDRDIGPKKKRRGKDWAQDAGEDFFYVQEASEISYAFTCGHLYLSLFMCPYRRPQGVSFGLADGVGGWIENGVNPALFSQSLMYHAHRYSRNAWAGEPEIDPTLDYEEREQVEGWELTPHHCLDLALGGVLRERSVQAGSSTACLLTLNSSSGLLRSANLGDSGYSIIRSSNVIYKEKIQTHFFNCPKQLTKLPANPGRKFARVCIDSPKEANNHSMKLRDGDIVVVYTDGFSDNVFPSEMLSICSLVGRKDVTEDEQVQSMADNLVLYARQCMMDRRRVSPFEREAAREGMFFRGGVSCSVTVLVALVRETS